MKPSLSWGSSFGDDFRVGSESVFGVEFRVIWDCALTNLGVSSGGSLVDYF
jgi:hypothetical protein